GGALMILNCLGDLCPIPVLKLKAALDSIAPGETIKVITDHSCTLQNIRDSIDDQLYNIACEEPANGIWEISISRQTPSH
ncbi:MAG TPA: sulfurtransferase TusA family protein, partial [Firmicutes bacterium]|nr:sulfurtransferase TusA family protein [Bacillota bacterium]